MLGIENLPFRARIRFTPSMKSIPMLRRSIFTPGVALLHDIGAPTETFLRRHRLPVHPEDPSTYVSIRSSWAFAHDLSSRQGIWDLGFRLAERVTVQRAARFGPRASTAITLGNAIRVMGDSINLDMPNVRIGLEKRGSADWFWRDHQPDRRHWPGYWIGEQFSLGIMVQLIRLARGADWFPNRMQVQAAASDWEFRRPKIAGDAQIEFGASRAAIELPPGSLERRMTRAESKPGWDPVRDSHDLPPTNLRESLHQLLMPVAFDQHLSLELGANILSTSKRSLQRRLAAEGISWREVVERIHLDSTLRLMEEPSNSLADIAYHLGYSQYPHFYRAFKRWTGESPDTYRKGLAL